MIWFLVIKCYFGMINKKYRCWKLFIGWLVIMLRFNNLFSWSLVIYYEGICIVMFNVFFMMFS